MIYHSLAGRLEGEWAVTTSAAADGPVVRKRPRDRRARIVAVAAQLFWRQGYRQVGMADVAGRVQIGASALYRHFRGKSDLLLAVLDEAVGRLEAATEGERSPAELLTAIAEVSVTRREYVAMWDREAGELEPGAAAELRARQGVVVERLDDAGLRLRGPAGRGGVPGRDPVRAVAALSVLLSPSRHHVELDPAIAVAMLRDAAIACLTVGLPTAPVARVRRPVPLMPRSRGEALLATASRLFAERGYHAVSLGEIGAATGIAGPSIYNHFASKLDLLTAILNRGSQTLWFALHRALAEADDERDALGRLVDSYADVVAGNPGVVAVLLSEVATLPDEARERFRVVQLNYVAEWVGLLQAWRPELAEAPARLLVHAALAVINAVGPGEPPGFRAPSVRQVRDLARSVLGLGPAGQDSDD